MARLVSRSSTDGPEVWQRESDRGAGAEQVCHRLAQHSSRLSRPLRPGHSVPSLGSAAENDDPQRHGTWRYGAPVGPKVPYQGGCRFPLRLGQPATRLLVHVRSPSCSRHRLRELTQEATFLPDPVIGVAMVRSVVELCRPSCARAAAKRSSCADGPTCAGGCHRARRWHCRCGGPC